MMDTNYCQVLDDNDEPISTFKFKAIEYDEDEQEITIPLKEYKELLEYKGRYLELKTFHPIYPNKIIYGDKGNIKYDFTCEPNTDPYNYNSNITHSNIDKIPYTYTSKEIK